MDLANVPQFSFKTGDGEQPINILFYNGTVEFQQFGQYEVPEKILIPTDRLKGFFKEVIKMLPQAEEMLAWKNKKE